MPVALDLARRLRDRGVACSCDLVAGGDGAVVVGVSGARWSHRGHDEHGTVDAALDRASRSVSHEGSAHRAAGRHAVRERVRRCCRRPAVARLDPTRFDRELSIREGDEVFVKVRPTDVPVYVEMGACECGIVGKDVLWESSRECYELADLGFGRCRLVLAAPRDSALAHGVWPQALRVATKYPVSARRFFAARSLECRHHPPPWLRRARPA